VIAGDAAQPPPGERARMLPSFLKVLRTASLGVGFWLLPLVCAGLWLGTHSVIFKEGLFFSKAAMLTFGGAYAVLPYVSQQAVESFSWLSASQMLDGLAFAETTPGPRIMVLEFVGFLGAWNQPAPFTPLLSATLGALMTVWCTFAPSFLWIFLGAPYVDRLQGNPQIAGVLAGQLTTDPAKCATKPPVFTSCYPASPIYWRHINALVNIRRTSPDAYPYSYGIDSTGKLVFIGSYGAYGVSEDRKVLGVGIPRGAKYLQGLEAIIDAKTLGFFKQGLTATTFQPAYTDTLGHWISVYTPIKDKAGKVVGAIGVDYKISYVSKVRRDVQRSLYPVFIVAYILLLGLVFVLSGQFAKRISRLNSVTRKVADGDYDVDISSSASAVFTDEMTELANSFLVMTKKVGDRERTLTQTVQVLRVEIDEAKRKDAVSEIVDSDFFNDLTKKAGVMRAKVKGLEIAEASAERASRSEAGSSDE
jgi:HAMP domain-containing protein